GAGIFVMTGRAAAQEAGPAIMVSYCVAGLGCALAAFCYAEFASMAPVAGSAYTYSYATLGELFAWIIGWELILEYAMRCACVAAAWSEYFNEFIHVSFSYFDRAVRIPEHLMYDPFSHPGAWFNLPAVAIMIIVTVILVIGIRESAITNALLVAIKLGVVLFVIVIGWGYINKDNWTRVPQSARRSPEEAIMADLAEKLVKNKEKLKGDAAKKRVEALEKQVVALNRIERERADSQRLVTEGRISQTDVQERVAA